LVQICDNPPPKTDAGGYIRPGFDAKLDELRMIETHGREWLSKLEQTERTETKIKELKISYNRITGYYFEIPTRLASSVPYRYTRKGSTQNTDRYTTGELKEIEDKILNSGAAAIEMEQKIFANLRAQILENVGELLAAAEEVAQIDLIQSFAHVAIKNNYVRPHLNENCILQFTNARHPVVENLVGVQNFIPNDGALENSTMLITGPNMAGKSTYMRMAAHITIMAHVGSFVPAESANIPITDRIFTRIGASDSLSTGESTFMVEMNEVSNIVHNAKKQSLILLDEVGRGTGTRDGLALATAIITYITDKIGENTMFATHFHELTNIKNPRIQNYKVLTEQVGGDIVFLHKLQRGVEQNSFGIDVAKLAGLPKEILENARRIL
jgi:DNA mismatch repair protein MutS